MRRRRYVPQSTPTAEEPRAQLRAMMLARGIPTICELSRVSGITRRTIHRAIGGMRLMPASAAMLAAALGVSVDALARVLPVRGALPRPLGDSGTATLLEWIGGES